jgi:hypothetical protein
MKGNGRGLIKGSSRRLPGETGKNIEKISGISGSYGGEYEDGSLLGCCAV